MRLFRATCHVSTRSRTGKTELPLYPVSAAHFDQLEMNTAERSLPQFRNRPIRVVHEVMRPAAQVRDRVPPRIEAEVAVKRGEHFLEVNGPVLGLRRVLVGRADDLS